MLDANLERLAGATGLEPATFGVTGRRFSSEINATRLCGAEKKRCKAKRLDSGVESKSGAPIVPCTHFVGFRDDRYWNAVKVFGRPHFIHRWWDKRAAREIAPGDTVVFAEGDWRQEPSRFNAPDIDERFL